MIVSRDEFSFFKCRVPPLNLKIFISGDAFDDSTFLYQQLKFTWLVRLGIAVEFGAKVDAPSWDPIPLYDTSKLMLVLPLARLAISASGFAIARSLTSFQVPRGIP